MKSISMLMMVFVLSSCTLFRPHKMDIEQGNIITQQNVSALHRGMALNQVKKIMGNPVLTNLFSTNRVDYIYTFQAGYEPMKIKRVTCIFYDSILNEIRVTDEHSVEAARF